VTWKHLLTITAAAALLTAGCDTDDTAEFADDPTEAEQDAGEGADTDDVDDSAAEDDGLDGDAAADNATGPQAYTSLLVQGDPDLTASGAVAITLGPAMRGSIPFLVYNGTDDIISRVEVSGMAIDADANTFGPGRSQGVEPNVIPPGGIGFGFVYVGPDDLPPDATIDSPALDYTVGHGEFENIVTLDVDELTVLDDGFDDFTGTLTNPHDIEVTGPISVGLACLDDTGGLTGVFSTFADRDNIEPGGTSTFTLSMYGDDVACDGYLAGASGYTDDF